MIVYGILDGKFVIIVDGIAVCCLDRQIFAKIVITDHDIYEHAAAASKVLNFVIIGVTSGDADVIAPKFCKFIMIGDTSRNTDAIASNFCKFIIIGNTSHDTGAIALKFSNFIIIGDTSSDTDAIASKFLNCDIIIHCMTVYGPDGSIIEKSIIIGNDIDILSSEQIVTKFIIVKGCIDIGDAIASIFSKCIII